MSKKEASKKKQTEKPKDQLTIYYENILSKVDALVKDKKINEALEMVNDELDSPYIPSEFEEAFMTISYNLSAEINYLNESVKYESLNREELFNSILNGKTINSVALSIFLERYKDNIEVSELKIFDSFLSSKKIFDIDKQNLIIALKPLNLDYEFDYYNSFADQIFKINIKSVNVLLSSPYFVELNKLVEEFTYKEPSLQEFCYLIIFDLYVYYFPNHPDYQISDLAYAIFQYMLNSLQGNIKEYKNPEIIKDIEKIVGIFLRAAENNNLKS
ncbi:conserved hypothetical protein [Malacoplasma penetrans HF-2]|uniref:DUF3196 domain-containing protein n=1 Tax=Malacoplasma penetrans (strain HF-2) TaxID=272633 RepID=Q8EUL9_MALP2|nr:DUF3196 family protein [Malacoplasma penetrans]BAC44693.1 conserved hypothetical protein [Malacoplasma penetrans HF-2]